MKTVAPKKPFSIWHALRTNHAFELGNAVFVRFLILGLGFLTTTLITRSLSVEGRGQYAILLNLLNFLMSIFSFGFHNSIIYSLSKKTIPFSSLYTTAWCVSLVSLCITGVCWITGVFHFFLPALNATDLLITLLGVPLVVCSYLSSFFFLGQTTTYKYNLFEFIKCFALFLCVLFFYHSSLSYTGYVGLFVLSNALHIALSFWSFLKSKLLKMSQVEEKGIHDVLKQNIRYSAISYGSNILYALISRYSLFFLSAFLDTTPLEKETLGYYAVALATIDTLSVFPSTLSFFMFPKISSSDDPKHRIKIVKNVILVCMLFFIATTICSFTIADFIFIHLYGAAYHAAVPLFQLLLPTALFLSFIFCITSFISGIGMKKVAIYAPMSGLVFMIPASFILLYKGFDIYRFIYIQNISYCIYSMIYLLFFIKKWKEA